MNLTLTDEQAELLREVVGWGVARARKDEDDAFEACAQACRDDRYRDLHLLCRAVRTHERIAALLERLG